MAPIRKSEGGGSSTTKDEQRRKRLRVDSDDDVQILEDDEVGRTNNEKCADGEKTSGKRGRSDSSRNSDQKGKGLHTICALYIGE